MTVTVVLCRAEGPANVGAVCRAMKTMGVGQLVLAQCMPMDEDLVRTYALSAMDIYQGALVTDSLPTALTGFSLAAGFSRRSGKKRKEQLDIRDFAASYGLQDRRIALVFGNERDGLSDDELDQCDLCVNIPTDAGFPSMNLSHAVQLACWELRRARLSRGQAAVVDEHSNHAAHRIDYEKSALTICDKLLATGFFKIGGRLDTERFVRELAARAALNQQELDRLERLFCKFAQLDRLPGGH